GVHRSRRKTAAAALATTTAGSRFWRLVMTPSISLSRSSTPTHLACSFSIQLVPSYAEDSGFTPTSRSRLAGANRVCHRALGTVVSRRVVLAHGVLSSTKQKRLRSGHGSQTARHEHAPRCVFLYLY